MTVTGVGPTRHAFVFANQSALVLPANRRAVRRVLRNVDPNRDVWLSLGAPAQVGKGIHLPPLGPAFETVFSGDIFAISDRPTLMYDSTDVDALLHTPGLSGSQLLIPGLPGSSAPAEMVFGYHDGGGKWGESAWRRIASTSLRKWANTTTEPGSLAPDVDFLDVENDTHVTADSAVTWTERMRSLGRTPIVYVETWGEPNWPQLIKAFERRGVPQPYYFMSYCDNLPGLTGHNPELASVGLQDQATWAAAGVIAKQWQSTLRALYGNSCTSSVSNADSLTLTYCLTASVGSLLRAKLVLFNTSDPGTVSCKGGNWKLVGKGQVGTSAWLYVFDVCGAAGTERDIAFTWSGLCPAAASCDEFAGWIGTPTREPSLNGIVRTGTSTGFTADYGQALATAQQLCTSDIAWAGSPGSSPALAHWGPHPPAPSGAGYQLVVTAPQAAFNCAHFVPEFAATNDLTTDDSVNGWSWNWKTARSFVEIETNYYDSGASYLQLGWDISTVFVSDLAIQEELG